MDKLIKFLLVLSIIFNIIYCFIIRFSLERKFNLKLQDFTQNAYKQLNQLTADSLSIVDNYVASNMVTSVQNTTILTNQLSNIESDTPVYRDFQSLQYSYFRFGGEPFAKIGIEYYTLGDNFPFGGTITDITPVGIVIDGQYLAKNTFSPVSSSVSPSFNALSTVNKEKLKK